MSVLVHLYLCLCWSICPCDCVGPSVLVSVLVHVSLCLSQGKEKIMLCVTNCGLPNSREGHYNNHQCSRTLFLMIFVKLCFCQQCCGNTIELLYYDAMISHSNNNKNDGKISMVFISLGIQNHRHNIQNN